MTISPRAILTTLPLFGFRFWKSLWISRLGRVMIYLAIAYVAILVVLLLLEDQLLYGRRDTDLSNPPLDIKVEDIEIISRRGERIHAWWSKTKNWRPEQGAVLFCHGKDGNLSHRGQVLTHWTKDMGMAVLLFDYPGYGKSSGMPSEDGCYAAGEAAYTWLRDVADVPVQHILLYGGSLGGGIAVDLANNRPHRALVLVAAFTSFPDMAQIRFPWLPGRWLVRNRFDNIEKIAHCRGPVFIAHSPQDGLIPFAQGKRLYDAACEPKYFFPMPNYRHNDLPTEEFYPALRRFLQGSEAKIEKPAA